MEKKAKINEFYIINAIVIISVVITLVLIVSVVINLFQSGKNTDSEVIYVNDTISPETEKTSWIVRLKNKLSGSVCGDGICQQGESGSCYNDCRWCGDGYCEENEACSSCSKDCGECLTGDYCGDNICSDGECKTCFRDCKPSNCIDGICESGLGENCLNSPSDCKCSLNQYCNNGMCSNLGCGNGICDNNETCSNCGDCSCTGDKICINSMCKTFCGNGICENDENKNSCPQDCGYEEFNGTIDANTNYPIVFVHGHSAYAEQVSAYSINAFNDFQTKLDSDKLYKNMGFILPNSNINAIPYGEWGVYSKPVSLKTTYYIGTLDSSGTFIRADEASRSINEYAQRLSKVVDIVMHHTGKNKVILVAHSMGGLVARAYIKNYNGLNKVDKLIMIGTPNQGFYKEDIYSYYITRVWNCQQAHPGQECTDMFPGSDFLNNLNAGDATPGNISYLTIAGNCCSAYNGEPYDETIRVSSVSLDGAINIVVNGQKSTTEYTFHGNLITPAIVPSVYNNVTAFLQGKLQ